MDVRAKVAFAISAVLSGVVAYAGDASAFWARHQYNVCNADPSDAHYYQGGNLYPANTLILQCPVTDTSTAPKTGITTFNVHVEDNNPGQDVWAFRCVDYYAAVGGACGNFASTSYTGIQTLHPPTFAGWNAADFGYLMIFLPPKNGASPTSNLKGFYTAG